MSAGSVYAPYAIPLVGSPPPVERGDRGGNRVWGEGKTIRICAKIPDKPFSGDLRVESHSSVSVRGENAYFAVFHDTSAADGQTPYFTGAIVIAIHQHPDMIVAGLGVGGQAKRSVVPPPELAAARWR